MYRYNEDDMVALTKTFRDGSITKQDGEQCTNDEQIANVESLEKELHEVSPEGDTAWRPSQPELT